MKDGPHQRDASSSGPGTYKIDDRKGSAETQLVVEYSPQENDGNCRLHLQEHPEGHGGDREVTELQ